MLIEVLKSKIHRVTVTDANLNYIGSITIDRSLMEAANLIDDYLQCLYSSINIILHFVVTLRLNGCRGLNFLNGAAARRVQPGDIVIILSYATMDFEEAKTFKPAVIFPDTATNKLK